MNRCAEPDAVVAMVSVVLTVDPEATWAWAGLRLHVGASVALPEPWYVTAHVRFTVPENPPSGESWMASVADPPVELMLRELDAGVCVTVDPAPVSDTVCGDPLALSVMVSVPARDPPAVGVNVTEIVQFAPAATLAPQVLVSAKSPEAAIDVIFNAAAPLLVSVTVSAALVVPVFCAANVRLAGDSVAPETGAPTTIETEEAVAGPKLESPP